MSSTHEPGVGCEELPAVRDQADQRQYSDDVVQPLEHLAPHGPDWPRSRFFPSSRSGSHHTANSGALEPAALGAGLAQPDRRWMLSNGL